MTDISKPSRPSPPAHSPSGAGGSEQTLAPQDRLAELASDIKLRGKREAFDIVEIGRALVEAKALCGHGNWLPWLEREFGWTDQTARNFMRVYDRVKSKNFLNFDLPVSALYQLAAPSTPPVALDIAIERTEAREKLSGAEVKKVVHEAKSKSSPRPLDGGTKKRGGEETKRHDARMKSARYKLEAFIRDCFDMAEWKELCEAIKTQLGAKHV